MICAYYDKKVFIKKANGKNNRFIDAVNYFSKK